MLFYSQIKKRFSGSQWRGAQGLFFDGKVRSVRLEDGRVLGEVVDSGAEFQARLRPARGTFSDAACTCGETGSSCVHVAALCIWIVERGSLLRAGIEEPSERVAPPVPDAVTAEPVAFVRPILETGNLAGVLVEPALRPVSGGAPYPVSRLIEETGRNTKRVWRHPEGPRFSVTHDVVPVLGTLDSARVTHVGQAALDFLAKLFEQPSKERVVLHEGIPVQLDPEPLRLVSLHVGKRSPEGRALELKFSSGALSLSSGDLAALSERGRLNSRYVWPEGGRTLYRFEVPLTMLARYANRSGLAEAEGGRGKRKPLAGLHLEDDAARPLHPLAAYRLSLELGVARFSVDPEWAEFHEWKKTFERKRAPSLPGVDYGFALRDYQGNGLSWLWSLYHRSLAALLADEMGLGKTHQVLALLSSLYRGTKKRPPRPSLVVAPTSVVTAWVQKLQKYDTGLSWHVYHGSDRELPPGRVDLVLTTYGILQKESALRETDWEVVILDEAQAIKNASTISNRASRVLKGRFRVAMTGTPVENQSADLWSVMEFLLPGYLGSLPRFRRLYGMGREIPGAAQAAALRRLVSPFLLRRTKAQVLRELPEKTEEIIPCEMAPSQRRVYRDYLHSAEADRLREELSGSGRIDYAGILALLTRLKQVCDHPRLPDFTAGRLRRVATLKTEESGKWEAFEEILREALGSGLKVVVFSQYLGMLDLIAHWLQTQGVGFAELRGATADRATPLERFASDPECKVFLCSLLAGGLGIDLTSASVCVHVDRWWNPAKENQATDRLHRIGQTRGVQVFKLQIPGTIEDRVASIIESKVALSGTLIEESPLGLKSFSRKELLALLADVQ